MLSLDSQRGIWGTEKFSSLPQVTQLAGDWAEIWTLVCHIGKVQTPSPAHMALLLKAGRIQAFLLSAHRASRLGYHCQSLLGIDGFLPSLAKLSRAPRLRVNYTIEKTNKLKEEQGSANSFFNDSEDQACLSLLVWASPGILGIWGFAQTQ